MPERPGPAGSRQGLPGVERLLSLSDGVVGIALTLLVLQLRVPALARGTGQDSAAALAGELAAGSGRLATYVISFYVVAQFWLAHHRVFRQITGHSEGLAWWNFAFLFTITVIPFTSDLLGTYPGNPLAVDIFAANLLLASVATQATLGFAFRSGLMATAGGPRALWAARARSTLVTGVAAVSMGVAWVSPSAATYCWLLMALAPRAAARWSARHPQEPPS